MSVTISRTFIASILVFQKARSLRSLTCSIAASSVDSKRLQAFLVNCNSTAPSESKSKTRMSEPNELSGLG